MNLLEHACNCTHAEIANMTDAEIVALCDLVGAETGELILKAGQREDAIANTLAKDLSTAYKADLDDAVNQVVKDIPEEEFNADRTPELLEGIRKQLETPQQLGMDKMLIFSLQTLLLSARLTTRPLIKATGRSVKNVSKELTERDLWSANQMTNIQLFWIGELWSNHLSARISATVAREAAQQGLGRQEVGRILRGVITTEFPAVRVPGTFAGSVDQYFTTLAGTVRTHGSSLGSIHTMADAGVERFEFVAVMDERTTEICQWMHGRQFTVGSALSMEDRILRAGDPNAYKEVAGWRSFGDVQRLAGGGDLESQSALLGAAGVMLPPLHGLCRSIVIPA